MEEHTSVGAIKGHEAAARVLLRQLVSSSLESAHAQVAQLQRVAHQEFTFQPTVGARNDRLGTRLRTNIRRFLVRQAHAQNTVFVGSLRRISGSCTRPSHAYGQTAGNRYGGALQTGILCGITTQQLDNIISAQFRMANLTVGCCRDSSFRAMHYLEIPRRRGYKHPKEHAVHQCLVLRQHQGSRALSMQR